MSTHPVLTNELLRLSHEHDGLLKPEMVVDAARQEASPLHEYFEWDDTEAGRRYRILQATRLIRVSVTLIGGDRPEVIRAFVSLKPDRTSGVGYRETLAVLQETSLRDQLLQDARMELASFLKKYKHLEELAEVFAAIKHVVAA